MTSERALCDVVVPFQIEPGFARGRLVRLCDSYRTLLANKNYPEPVAAMLGEALVLASVLASGLKYDGAFTLQTKTDGPVGMLVADVTSGGELRGCAKFDAERVAAAAARPGAPVPRLLGNGYMAFTVDQGPDTERYQGIIELGEGTLSECAHAYFRQSEQIDTAIILHASPSGPHGAVASALMIQRLPATEQEREQLEDAWRRVVAFTGTATARELLDTGLPPHQLLFRLYHEDGVRVFADRPLRFGCRCSQERVESMLRSFSPEQVEEFQEDGMIRVTCEFCGASYAVDPGSLR